METREFFLSEHEDCTSDLQVKLRRIPNSTSGKQLQQERRTKVKLIKEGLNALTKKQAEYGKRVYAHMKAGEGEETPAADIHMFPEDLGDVKSSWQVLVVPRVKELFGKTRFLCHQRGGFNSCNSSLCCQTAISAFTNSAIEHLWILGFTSGSISIDSSRLSFCIGTPFGGRHPGSGRQSSNPMFEIDLSKLEIFGFRGLRRRPRIHGFIAQGGLAKDFQACPACRGS